MKKTRLDGILQKKSAEYRNESNYRMNLFVSIQPHSLHTTCQLAWPIVAEAANEDVSARARHKTLNK